MLYRYLSCSIDIYHVLSISIMFYQISIMLYRYLSCCIDIYHAVSISIVPYRYLRTYLHTREEHDRNAATKHRKSERTKHRKSERSKVSEQSSKLKLRNSRSISSCAVRSIVPECWTLYHRCCCCSERVRESVRERYRTLTELSFRSRSPIPNPHTYSCTSQRDISGICRFCCV